MQQILGAFIAGLVGVVTSIVNDFRRNRRKRKFFAFNAFWEINSMSTRDEGLISNKKFRIPSLERLMKEVDHNNFYYQERFWEFYNIIQNYNEDIETAKNQDLPLKIRKKNMENHLNKLKAELESKSAWPESNLRENVMDILNKMR